MMRGDEVGRERRKLRKGVGGDRREGERDKEKVKREEKLIKE